ncbi:membrane protein insertion efficiency factor YidD [cf. Phormidesmis sp. LEGE 11477]|uniref:membrane protein insertion efficiency factor YidD n=1 Tax=cf. Phormidesmis sp. LEGE 11477 TaxID=1828680 RepID=UPI0018803900|nr:membrane protein insertion efficiency factor YidD [cf. Phormidesmis sp. LEGE 11477]
MPVYTFDQLACRTAISSINTYQRYLSPRKGFSCPHRVLYRGESCSEHVKQTLKQQDLLSAVQMASTRFRACHQAAVTLSSSETNLVKINLKTKLQSGCIVIPCCIPI